VSFGRGFAQKVVKSRQVSLSKNVSHAKAQRSKEKPKKRGSALRLCAFAWEIFPWHLSFCAMPLVT
jgi:hypothetical protein